MVPDYQLLIDQEVWDFIERTNRCYPSDAVQLSIAEQRKIYTAMCQEFHRGRPADVLVNDDVVNADATAIPVRRYVHRNQAKTKTNSHIIYIHGGGFVVGGLDSHDDVCAEICNTTKLSVTSIDYRLSPEHKHPAAFNDCLAVVQNEANRVVGKLILCGDSAGASLCASVSHWLRTQSASSPIKAQVLIYPALGTDTNTESCINHAQAPMLTLDEVKYYMKVRVLEKVPNNDASFAVLHDTDYSNLPKTLVVSAECDPLCDDGKLYCHAIAKAGGDAQWICEPGLVHGYLRARHSSEKAKASFRIITEQLSSFASEPAIIK